jgi:hypothetical protein
MIIIILKLLGMHHRRSRDESEVKLRYTVARKRTGGERRAWRKGVSWQNSGVDDRPRVGYN